MLESMCLKTQQKRNLKYQMPILFRKSIYVHTRFNFEILLIYLLLIRIFEDRMKTEVSKEITQYCFCVYL